MASGDAEKPKKRSLLHSILLTMKILALLVVPVMVRVILLIGMGVGKKDLQNAMLDFPPPPPLTGTGPFPLMLKFHKVAGSTFVDTLWRNVQCGELEGAWRQNLCGEYDTHKNLMFVRGGLPFCTRTPTYKVVAVFRRPLDKFVSTLYWYPPTRFRTGPPWTAHIGNWTRHDVRFMLSKLSADRNPLLEPPLQEYTAVLGSGSAHGGNLYKLGGSEIGGVGAVGGAEVDEEQQHDDDKKAALFAESRSDPTARKRAIKRIREDETLVLGITERLDASMVLVALSLGWPLEAMLYESKKRTEHLKPGDARYNVNSGKYHLMSPGVKEYIMYLLRADERVYHVALAGHEQQTRKFKDFPEQVARFRGLLAEAHAAGGAPHQQACPKRGNARLS